MADTDAADPADPATPRRDGSAGPVERSDPGSRGSLQVADRVLERIARRAAAEVDGIAPSTGGGALGTLLDRGYPSVEVQQAGSHVRVQVDVAALWPRPASTVAAGVRTAVAQRLSELAAVRVDAVAVTVRDVVRPARRQGREEGARAR